MLSDTMNQAAFSHASGVFKTFLQEQPEGVSAQFCVRHRGQKVLDLAGSSPATNLISSSTPFLTFSVSKAFSAAAIWHLIDDRIIELDAPVSTYWPAFGQKGKEKATIRHVLLHQAGIPAPHFYRQLITWPSWQLVTHQVARSRAEYPPGTRAAYHLVNFGFILGEVVRRVTGLPIDQYLAKNFFEPMGLNQTWMRIPSSVLNTSPRLVALSSSTRSAAWLFNLPIIRHSLLPAAGLHSTANELSTFFQMLLDDGIYNGKRYLQPETIRYAAQSHYDGFDHYIQGNINWGLGLIMGGGKHGDPDKRKLPHGYGSSAATFSAMGMGTCMVWADRNTNLVTAFTCNGMLGDKDTAQRWARLSNAVWDSLQEHCNN